MTARSIYIEWCDFRKEMNNKNMHVIALDAKIASLKHFKILKIIRVQSCLVIWSSGKFCFEQVEKLKKKNSKF